MTSPPIFPALAGQGWSVHKKPTFATTVASHVSAREVRSPNYANPIWQFELTFDGLDATAGAQYGGLGAQSLQSLMGLYLRCQGQYGAFLYYDPNDFSVSAQAFGTGDGVTKTFALTRALGGFVEPVVAPVLSATTLYFPEASFAVVAPVIMDNGATVSAANYAIANPGGGVTFTTAPASGHALTWSGFFGFLCRFDGDDLNFEQVMANLWRVQSVKFRSLRAQ